MTYKENYEKLKTPEEIRKEVINDLAIAKMFNTDRIPVIIKSANEVLLEKFGVENYKFERIDK